MGQRDICLKRYLCHAERFADLINGILGQGDQLISPQDLTDMDSQVGYHGCDRPGYRDLLKKAAFGVNFLVIGIENQEHTNYLMPLRCLSYDTGEYERQAAVEKSRLRRWKKMKGSTKSNPSASRDKESRDRLSREEYLSGVRKGTKLHPCITLVLYFGEEWDGASSLHELLDFSGIPEKLRQYVNDYPVYIVHVRRLQDTSVFQTDLKLVFDCIRFSDDKDRLYQSIQENELHHQLDEDAYDVIARYTKVFGDKKIAVSEGGKVDMCKAMQELREDWTAEGRQDMVFELLKEVGSLSETLEKRIRQECSLQVLCVWAKLAMQVKTIQEFEQAMDRA